MVRKMMLAAIAALTASLLAAPAALADDYGDSYGASAGTGDSYSKTSGSSDTAGTASAGWKTGEVKTWKSNLGMIVVDSKGRTLYAFTKDTKGGPSTCYGECATAWPAAKADTTLSGGSGMTGKLGTSTRKDGTKQLTLNGWNLYYFAKDEGKAGWTKGQGVKDVWFVVDGSGKLVKSAQGSLPFTGPSDWLLPIGGTIVAAGLVMLVVTKRRGGLHTARPRH